MFTPKGRTQPWQTGRDSFLPTWQSRKRTGSYTPSKEPSKFPTAGTKTKSPTKSDSKTPTRDDKKGLVASSTKKEVNKIISLKKEIAENLKENIVNILKKNENFQDLLTEKENLSEIAQAFKLINHNQLKLTEEEIKNLEKNENFKKTNSFFIDQIKEAIPYIIKLCKFIPPESSENKKQKFETEQKASLAIYTQIQKQNKDLKNATEQELTKYEKEIWKQITQINKEEPLRNIDNNQLQNLTLIFAKEPKGKIYQEHEKDLAKINAKIEAPTKEALIQQKTEEAEEDPKPVE